MIWVGGLGFYGRRRKEKARREKSRIYIKGRNGKTRQRRRAGDGRWLDRARDLQAWIHFFAFSIPSSHGTPTSPSPSILVYFDLDSPLVFLLVLFVIFSRSYSRNDSLSCVLFASLSTHQNAPLNFLASLLLSTSALDNFIRYRCISSYLLYTLYCLFRSYLGVLFFSFSFRAVVTAIQMTARFWAVSENRLNG